MNGISREAAPAMLGRVLENHHLRYFVEVVKCLHVTKAAKRLHITQPTLIHQIEEELGVELFHRDGHRLTLTQAGQVFLKEAEASLLQFDHAQRAAPRAAWGEVGKLALGFQSTAGLSVVPHILLRFQTSYPDVEVVLHEMGSAMLKRSLRRGEIDPALIYAVSDDEFANRNLAPEPRERFILAGASAAEVLHHALRAECAAAGFQPSAVQEVTTLQTGLGLIAARFGVSILPASIEFLGRKGLSSVLSAIAASSSARAVLARENPSPIVIRLLECIDQ